MDKVSYALGLGIGRQLCDMGAKALNIDDFAQAIKDVIAGSEPQIGDQEAQQIVQNFFQEQEKKQRAVAEEKHKGSAIMRECLSTAQYSTAVYSAANLQLFR